MSRSRSSLIGLAGALMLAACSSASDQPGAVTADEAHQLDEAAAMLDANSVDLNAVAQDASVAGDVDTSSNKSDRPR